MDISGTKKRLLLLLEYLYKNTDEEHQASTNDITLYLQEQGFVIDRKTLRSDLNLLMSMDYDIVTVKSSPNRYFWGERAFKVSSARFISEDKSRQLIRKITSLAGPQQVPELKRHITAIGKSKSDNKSLYYIIDTITNAINSGRKIQFQYVEYNGRKEKILRNNGEVYVLSPTFYGWVFQFGGKIRIIGPDEAMQGFQRLLDSFGSAHS